MRKETIQLRKEVKTLAENVETQQKHIDIERCELDEFKNLVEISEVSKTFKSLSICPNYYAASYITLLFYQGELAQVCLIPVQLHKEVNRVAHKKSYVM